jgi:hypothetical protein
MLKRALRVANAAIELAALFAYAWKHRNDGRNTA